jgi:L-lactate dehydrogenase complex protein LldG
MNATTSSRERILGRIHKATASGDVASYTTVPRLYDKRGRMPLEQRVKLMAERLREYGAEVVECLPAELIATIAARLEVSDRHVIAAPEGLPAEWLISGCSWRVDHGLSYAEIEGAQGVVTAASAGVADSGTIVLHHGPAEGRRVLSLLPDCHLCILRTSQIVESLPEYFDRFPTPPTLATYISGPSATADIEMTRIKGVHGPRHLIVILVRDTSSTPGKLVSMPAAGQAGTV